MILLPSILAACLPIACGQRCVALSVESDGAPDTGARIELSLSGKALGVEACAGGFRVPPELSSEDQVDVVIATSGRRFRLGSISTRKFNVGAWKVVVDTPPFAPDLWIVGVPNGVKEVMYIRFVPLDGDGTCMAIFDHESHPPEWRPSTWRDVLRRVDLLAEDQCACVPRVENWGLDTPVKLFTAGNEGCGEAECSACDGFVHVISADELKSTAEDVLSDQPGADAAALLRGLIAFIQEDLEWDESLGDEATIPAG